MRKQIVHPGLYDRGAVNPSYWNTHDRRSKVVPLVSDTSTEVAIIGGGYAGLSCAYHLARDHQIDTLVLEAGDIGWGASGRNAGFNTLPASKLSTKDIFQRWPEAEAKAFFASQLEGQELIYDLADREGFDLQPCGKGTYWVAHSKNTWVELEEEHYWLQKGGIPCELMSQGEFAAVGHRGPEQCGALHLQSGGGINPMALVYGLASSALRRGAKIHGRSPVIDWEKRDGQHILRTPTGLVRAKHVVVATNGYRDGPEPESISRRVLPAISNIVVSGPLSDAQWEAIGIRDLTPIVDTRKLVTYYRRLPDQRLLLGARSDTWGSPRKDAEMQVRLLNLVKKKFPDAGAISAEFFWRGLVTVSRKMTPAWGRAPDDTSISFYLGCFGSGVNTMPWMGRTIARSIAGIPLTPREACAVFRSLPSRLPGSPLLQRTGLKLAYLIYALKDHYV